MTDDLILPEINPMTLNPNISNASIVQAQESDQQRLAAIIDIKRQVMQERVAAGDFTAIPEFDRIGMAAPDDTTPTQATEDDVDTTPNPPSHFASELSSLVGLTDSAPAETNECGPKTPCGELTCEACAKDCLSQFLKNLSMCQQMLQNTVSAQDDNLTELDRINNNIQQSNSVIKKLKKTISQINTNINSIKQLHTVPNSAV